MFSASARRKNAARAASRTRPRFEWLEDRLVLSTFRVNTTLDTVAVDFKRGKDAAGHISLRSAIMAADSRGGSNTIILPSGVFKLTIAGDQVHYDLTGSHPQISTFLNAAYGGSFAGLSVYRSMDPGPLICTLETELDEVRRMMLDRHARYLPVIDNQQLMGVISFYDVAKSVVDSQNFENQMLKAYIRDWPAEDDTKA